VKTFDLRVSFLQVHQSDDQEFSEHCAYGMGTIQIRQGAFGPIFVAVSDGKESLLPVDLARTLFGDLAIDAVIARAG
jgi:hypothetical protein